MKKLNDLLRCSKKLDDFGIRQPKDLLVLQQIAKSDGGLALMEVARIVAPEGTERLTPGAAQLVLKRLEIVHGYVVKQGVRKAARYVLTKKGKDAIE